MTVEQFDLMGLCISIVAIPILFYTLWFYYDDMGGLPLWAQSIVFFGAAFVGFAPMWFAHLYASDLRKHSTPRR